MAKEHTIETTLGDLIFTLTEETCLLVRDEQVAYRVVAHLLSNLLRKSEPITEQ
ncbi:MAG: hypothetical protein U1E51_13000 [Candidatus Binatia bacterium]|nr:hypothetical protein [Candidatus Binatia bacterium]